MKTNGGTSVPCVVLAKEIAVFCARISENVYITPFRTQNSNPCRKNIRFFCKDSFGSGILSSQGLFRVWVCFGSGFVSGPGLFRVRVCFGSGMMGQGCWAGTKGQWVWDHGTGIRNLWSRFLVSLAFSLHYSKTPLCLGNRNDISSPEVSHHVFPLLYR